ncbi:hypothetical protein NQ176_g1444 [Zarea fungicola]|uniref:Uncharacterized protein n=1 Tax=Zarea fungicola TaxID=93591 RepID=A0ACC1NU40_9HYPO|nr:hypothetical protein NQ176_g1444 [Lecanicillium fungicola]
MSNNIANGNLSSVQNFTSIVHHDTYPEIAQSDHRGKTVFITGASRGIGRATALAFVRAGVSTIIIAARSSLETLKEELHTISDELKLSTNIIALSLDVTSEDQIAAALTEVTQQVLSIDILINNAGYLEQMNPVGETDKQGWWKAWEVNLKGIYLIVHAFLPMVLQSSSKTIINIASRGGLYTRFGASAYGGSKAAAIRFTEFLDTEYKDQGLVAIAVHPGSVLTDLALGLPQHAHSILVDTAELAADGLAWISMERREWLGGRYVSVNWDMPELISRQDEIVAGDMLKLRLVV